MFQLEFLTQFEASNAKYKSVDRKSRWAAAGIDWTLLVIEMCGDCLVGDPGLSDDAITGPHHQIQSVEKIAILYWPLRPVVSDNTGAQQTAFTGWKKCKMCPIWKSIEKCGIDKNVTLFVDAVKITGIIPEV